MTVAPLVECFLAENGGTVNEVVSLRHTFHLTSHKATRVPGCGLHFPAPGTTGSPSRKPCCLYHYWLAASPATSLPVLKSRTVFRANRNKTLAKFPYEIYSKINYIIVLLFLICLMKFSSPKENYNTDSML